MCHHDAPVQNEPTAGARRLSLRQLAAARLLVCGYGSLEVARRLGVNHHTIGRWKRDTRFAAEIERLRRAITEALASPHGKAAPPPQSIDPLAAFIGRRGRERGRGRASTNPRAGAGVARAGLTFDLDAAIEGLDEHDAMGDAEFAATEAWVEQVIHLSRAGRKIPPPPPAREPL